MKTPLARLAALAFAAAISGGAAAQAFPTKPIRMVLGFPAGSATEAIYRPLIDNMTQTLGQNVLYEYKPGGGSVVASLFVKGQPADGYTIFLASNAMTVKSVAPNPPFDIRKDYTPIAPLASSPFILVVNAEQIKATTVQQLLAEAKARPGQINYASYGIGSGAHMFTEILLNEAKASMLHVPFQGTAAAVTDTVGGRTQVTVSVVATLRPHVTNFGGTGKLRVLAVSTAERTPLVPGAPGMKEAGFPQIDYAGWAGIVGPAGMNREVVNKLNAAINTALRDAQVQKLLAQGGVVPTGGTPEELVRVIDGEYNAYAKLIKDTGLKLE